MNASKNVALISVALAWLLFTSLGCGSKTSAPHNEESQTQEVPDTTAIGDALLVKWKAIEFTEYGPVYVFEAENGANYRYTELDIPGFDPENNPYFSINRMGTMHEYTLKASTATWLKLTLEKRMLEMEGSGETAEVEVIVGMEAAN